VVRAAPRPEPQDQGTDPAPSGLLFQPSRGFKPMIVVKQLEPGQRGRVPFAWRRGEPLLNSEAVAERVFWAAVAGANITIVERAARP
jgi:hypothetical protein